MQAGSSVHGAHHFEWARFTHLLRALSVRDFKGKYRRSLLGPGWALLQPLLYMVLFTFLRGVLNISSEGVSYTIFTFSALVPWTFFANAVSRSAGSIYVNRGIIKKMKVTKEVFPAAGVVVSLVDLVMAGAVLAGMMVWFGSPVGASIIWLPVLIALTVLLAFGVGLGCAAIGTYKQDIVFAIPFLLQFWLLASPIMYPLTSVPARWRDWYSLNPLVGLIEGYRSVLIRGSWPDGELLLLSALVTGVVLAVAWPLFRYLSQYFADVL